MSLITNFFKRHPRLKAFVEKVMQDNVGMLATVVAWTLLTSIVPIAVGLIGISGFLLHDPTTQRQVEETLSRALAGVVSRKDLSDLVALTIQHRGLLAAIGVVGVVWGGARVGGAISTVFQPIFRVGGRNFFKEKLIDIAMIFVFTALLLIQIAATTAVAFINRLFSTFTIPAVETFIVGAIIGLLAGFFLFSSIYIAFPNVKPRFRFHNIWPGAGIAAFLFQALSYIFPIYSHFARLTRYGALLGGILVLTTWIYFFSIILLIGAEFVAIGALAEARRERKPVGPAPSGVVPQLPQTAESSEPMPADKGEDIA